MRAILVGLLGLLTLLPVAGRADEKQKDEKPKQTDLPIKAKLVAKKTTFTLDLGGKSADEFKKAVKDGEKAGKLPEPPAVDLVLEVTNTSDKEVEIWFKGDAVKHELELKGNGVLNAAPLLAFTTEFRVPEAMMLAPGKTHSTVLRSMKYGFRGVSQQAYWTETGDYTLTASFKTGLKPAPKDAKNVEDGLAKVTVTSEPIKLKVEAK